MMKHLKVSLSLLALVLGAGSAFATVAHKDLTERKWARDAASGVYSDITGQQKGVDYECDNSSAICTATYPDGVNPNSNPDHVAPLSTEQGLFQ